MKSSNRLNHTKAEGTLPSPGFLGSKIHAVIGLTLCLISAAFALDTCINVSRMLKCV